jgi:hypothetical protein
MKVHMMKVYPNINKYRSMVGLVLICLSCTASHTLSRLDVRISRWTQPANVIDRHAKIHEKQNTTEATHGKGKLYDPQRTRNSHLCFSLCKAWGRACCTHFKSYIMSYWSSLTLFQ